jgi:hypothetical protein
MPLQGSAQQDSGSQELNSAEFRLKAATRPIPIIDDLPVQSLSVHDFWFFSHGGGKKWMGGGARLPLSTLLLATGHLRASDERDKIFALVGLSSDIGKDIIDYSKDLNEIQVQVARLLIEREGSWGPFFFTNVNPFCRSKELPSWVPDWANVTVKYSTLAAYRLGKPYFEDSVFWAIDGQNVSVDRSPSSSED